MEIQARPATSALESIGRIAASPFGKAIFDAIGQLMVAQRGGQGAFEVHQPEKPEDVLNRLVNAPHKFDLFAALRLVECAYQDMPRLGEAKRPRDEPVRIGQHISFAFSTSDIEAVEAANEFHPARLKQNVLGLLGTNGALPLHLTEYAFERKRHDNDETIECFLDIFHHRMLLLFYRAWAGSQPVISLDRPKQDRFGGYVAALCGLGMPTLRNRDSVEDEYKLSQAGIFGRHVKCAEGLQILLVNYFGVEVQVDQWVGYWLPIPESERIRLGSRKGFSVLGQDAVIGERIWDCQTKFSITIGPLSLEYYLRFLPNGPTYRKFVDIVELYIGVELEWDLQLLLRHDKIPPLQLGGQASLGWTTWFGDQNETHGAVGLIISSTRGRMH